jgi:hypothetical protein
MIQMDMCEECPKCKNGSLTQKDKYKYFGLKYDYTEYRCLMKSCGFTAFTDKNNLFFYNQTQIQHNRDKVLKKLGI